MGFEMDLENLKEWLAIATSFATLVALVVGLIQLFYVRRQMELQTNLAVMQAERSVWGLALQRPDIAPNVMKERWGAPAEERLFAAMLIDHYEALYFQHRRGAIPKSYWAPIAKAMIEHIASPCIQTVWRQHEDLYWPDFARFVNAGLAQR
jgi:hypothetical protein